MIIAIDGPAASGKSTVAKAVARRLGIQYLDTGAMYRAVTWLALERGIAPDDAEAVTELALAHPVTFAYEDGAALPSGVFVDGIDVTTAVRLPAVDSNVSAVASIPAVRVALVEQQRVLAGVRDTVMEGRDIGTVVFPAAEVKVFLTASPEERARRRRIDLANQGHDVQADEVQARLERRDHLDSTREASPLGQAADAELLDTTGLTIDDLTSGFRYYNADACRLLAGEEATLLDYQDIGVLLIIRHANLRVAEIPVAMNPRRVGASRVFSSWWTVGRYMLETTLLCLASWNRGRAARSR